MILMELFRLSQTVETAKYKNCSCPAASVSFFQSIGHSHGDRVLRHCILYHASVPGCHHPGSVTLTKHSQPKRTLPKKTQQPKYETTKPAQLIDPTKAPEDSSRDFITSIQVNLCIVNNTFLTDRWVNQRAWLFCSEKASGARRLEYGGKGLQTVSATTHSENYIMHLQIESYLKKFILAFCTIGR